MIAESAGWACDACPLVDQVLERAAWTWIAPSRGLVSEAAGVTKTRCSASVQLELAVWARKTRVSCGRCILRAVPARKASDARRLAGLWLVLALVALDTSVRLWRSRAACFIAELARTTLNAAGLRALILVATGFARHARLR